MKNYYSERIKLINFISADMKQNKLDKTNKVDYAALQKGFFSEFVRSEYGKEIEELEDLDKSVEPTKEQLFSYSNYFIKYPDRLAGQLKMSSTYIFPVYSTANLNESVEFLKNQVALLKGNKKATSTKKEKIETPITIYYDEYLPKFLSEKFGTMKGYEFIRQIKGDTDFPIKKEVKEYVTPNGRPRIQTEYYFIEFEGRKIILDKYLHDFFAQLRSSYLKENGYRYTQDEFLKMFDNINIVGNPVFYHYESISSVIKNKKDVNTEVLKEYPDLLKSIQGKKGTIAKRDLERFTKKPTLAEQRIEEQKASQKTMNAVAKESIALIKYLYAIGSSELNDKIGHHKGIFDSKFKLEDMLPISYHEFTETQLLRNLYNDFYNLFISNRIGVDNTSDRVVFVFDKDYRKTKSEKYKPITIKNDYVFVLDGGNMNRYIDTSKMTQEEAQKINKERNFEYNIVPRAYAIAMNYKKVQDTENLKQDTSIIDVTDLKSDKIMKKKQATQAEKTKALKQHIFEKFKDIVKTSIRYESFSGGTAYRIEYFAKKYNLELERYLQDKLQYFDGVDNFDSQQYRKAEGITHNGVFVNAVKFISVSFTETSQKRKEKKAASKSNSTKSVVSQNTDIQLIDYSDKSIAVVGDTYSIKDKLKNLGGRFNRGLTVNGERTAGWIFKKEQKTELERFVSKSSQSEKPKIDEAKMKRIRINKGKLKLLALKNQSLDGLHGLNGLAGLGSLDRKLISDNESTLGNLIKTDNPSNKKTKSFEYNFERYNKGITQDEIKAWVWFKQSQGSPMIGWEKYFLKSTGKNEELLVTTQSTVIKDNSFVDEATIPSGSVLGKPTKFKVDYNNDYVVFSDKEGSLKFVNKNHTKIQRTTATADPKELDKLIKAGVLFFGEADYLPLPLFTFGNIYDRMLSLEKYKGFIIENYGQEVYDNHKQVLEDAKPKPLSVLNPDATKRLKILPFSKFAKEYIIENDSDGNLVDTDYNTLYLNFHFWLKENKKLIEIVGITYMDIIKFYLQKKIKPRDKDNEEWSFIQTSARLEGERLFDVYLNQGISFEDQQRIDVSWNRTFNGFASLNYKRIPIGMETSRLFKGMPLSFMEAQREAVAFIDAVGSGCLAYDVGVGKTLAAILILAQNLQNGTYKRPLLVVPKPTYRKWINEIIGYTNEKGEFVEGALSHLNIKINNFYNLNAKVVKKIPKNKAVEEGSISIVNFNGFTRLGLSKQGVGDMLEELSSLLHKTSTGKRAAEINKENTKKIVGRFLRDTVVDFDVLGFDSIVIDEAHNMRKIFSFTPTIDGKKRYSVGEFQKTSERGLTGLILTNFVQRKYGGNVTLLTATPFNNSPLEVYSMLGMIGLSKMRKAGIDNVERFMETFIQETDEFIVKQDGKLAYESVVKSFQNKKSLQSLVFNYINFKTGEDAGVRRPIKINLPRLSFKESDGTVVNLSAKNQLTTYLEMNNLQKEGKAIAMAYLDERDESGRLPAGNIFRAMNANQANAFSPFLVVEDEPVDYRDFVRNSPKIEYALECIRTVVAHHKANNTELSGQVIYANRGIEFFPMMKEYLEKEIGFKKGITFRKKKFDEVEILTGGSSQKDEDRKENVKEAFLAGKIKVVIGSGTIREGIDLQTNGSVLYNLYPEYNPTNVRQLEGRIWRQGNKFGYVRVVMPLVQDSMDVFIFQKLEEKSARINDIWAKSDNDSNVLDEESLNPEAIKFALYTDLYELTKMRLNTIAFEIERVIIKLNNELESLAKVSAAQSKFNYSKEFLHKKVEQFKGEAAEFIKENDIEKADKDQKRLVERYKDRLNKIAGYDGVDSKYLLAMCRSIERLKDSYYFRQDFENYLGTFAEALKVLKQSEAITSQYESIEKAIEATNKQLADKEKELKDLKSPEYQKTIYDQIVEEKKKLNIQGRMPKEAVKDFSDLNYLLDYKMADVDGIEGNPLPTDKPKETKLIANKTASNDKAKRIRINKGKLKLLQLKMNELNGIYA